MNVKTLTALFQEWSTLGIGPIEQRSLIEKAYKEAHGFGIVVKPGERASLGQEFDANAAAERERAWRKEQMK